MRTPTSFGLVPAATALAAIAGCNLILGLEPAHLYAHHGGEGGNGSTGTETAASTATGTGANSTTGTGSTASTSTGTGGHAPTCDTDAGMADCTGSCVDPQTDQHNCGRCGHDCMHGACLSGMCQAWTVYPSTTVTALGADEKFVTWIDTTTSVNQTPTSGGALVTVSQLATAVQGCGVVLDGGTIAFCGSNRLYGVPEGMAATTTASFFNGPYGPGPLALLPDGTTAYMLGVTTKAPYSYYLLVCPLLSAGNNACTPLNLDMPVAPAVQGQNLATTLLVNATSTYAFWLYSSNPPSVVRYTYTSNVVNSFTYTAGNAAALAIDADNVYWVAAPNSSIYSLPQSSPTTATPNTLAASMNEIAGLASDGTNLYYGLNNAGLGSATLDYVPVGGGAGTTLFTSPMATGLGAESFVVTAGGAVYWADVNLDMFPPQAAIMGIAAP